ncbi:MAG TPA: glycosyltransferase [Kineosporiaceae bacterium]
MLHLVYRAYGGQNMKNRPSFFSKKLGLQSFLRAAAETRDQSEIIFVNDGPMPDDLLELMRPHGRIIQLPGVGMRRSYVFSLQMPQRLNWADGDVVWYSEDDYLYRPEAFTRLIAAAEAMPEVDYFALYGGYSPEEADPDGPPEPRNWWAPSPAMVDGQEWRRLLSTASTFGGRAKALREDYRIFRFCMIPHKTMYRDHDTAVAIQGFEPHHYGPLLRQLAGLEGESAKERVRNASLAPFLLATNLRSHRRPSRRRLYLAAKPCLAAHMEIGQLSPGADWEQVARDIQNLDAAGQGATHAHDQSQAI